MRDASRGTAAVDHRGCATEGTEGEAFFQHQLREARVASAEAARRLAAACARAAPPDELDRLAKSMTLAAAELRIAVRALGLSAHH
jgi:hypothetical protein